MTNVSSEKIAKIYWDKVWKLHEIPQMVFSNRELQFTSTFMEDLMKVLGTKKILPTAYHPQTDGQIKWINQEVGIFLRYYVNYQQDNWTNWLAAAEFQYNNKKHIATGHTPFELNFERHSWKGNLIVQMEFPKLEEFLIELQRSWKEVTKSIEIAKEAMKRQFDKKRQNSQELKAEDNM